jgi:hypothetical protein
MQRWICVRKPAGRDKLRRRLQRSSQRMTEANFSQQASASRGAVSAFSEVCEKFQEISKSGQSGYLPIYGGQWAILKFIARHPIHAYASLFREAIRAQSSLGILVSSFPLETMIAFLTRFTEAELKTLKTLSEMQLRRMKSLVTDNPVLKVSVPLGSAYALLKVSNELVKGHDSQLDFLKSMFETPAVQSLTGSLLFGFIIGLAALGFQYVFLTVPTIARAQILDDMLQIALEEKHFGPGPIAENAVPLDVPVDSLKGANRTSQT